VLVLEQVLVCGDDVQPNDSNNDDHALYPNCGCASTAVHSTYERGVADLPIAARKVLFTWTTVSSRSRDSPAAGASPASARAGHRWWIDTIAWVLPYLRLALRYHRHAASVMAFLHLTCALICVGLPAAGAGR
jgi:hypothetical protein